MAAQRIVILGAGIGGLVLAHELRRRLGSEHQIIVVDKEAEHRFQASYLWLMMGWRQPAAICRPLARLTAKGIDFRQATVQRIDTIARTVVTDAANISYDFLVVALGAQLVEDGIPGMAEAGYTPYTLEGATSLREAWQQFDGGSVAVVIAGLPFKCPAAPYEAAFLLDSGFRKRGLRRLVDISLFTPETLPMAVTGPAVGQALTGMLEQRDIGFTPAVELSQVDAPSRRLIFADGKEAKFDLLIYVPPHRSPLPVRESSLAGEAGWIPVDPRTLQTNDDHVFALGDVAAVPLANGMMLPKAGVFAHGQAETVARRIAARISGTAGRDTYDGWGACFVEIGSGKAAYGSGDFYHEPSPAVTLHTPTRSWRMGKVVFEKAWLAAIGGSPKTSAIAFGAMSRWARTLQEQPRLWRWI